jgi:AcrR family transcriptional regulator
MVAKQDYAGTRAELLAAAFQEILYAGFQAASLSQILQQCRVTKGALYHHFSHKKALGLAVLDEIIRPEIERMWMQPVINSDDPLVALHGILQANKAMITDEFIKHGCPLNNLAQEMSSVDNDFRVRIDALYADWRQCWVQALRQGQQDRKVRSDINVEHAVTFIIAALEGCIGMAKNARSREVLFSCAAGLMAYLDTLKAVE